MQLQIPTEDSNMLGGRDMSLKDGEPLSPTHVGWGDKREVNLCLGLSTKCKENDWTPQLTQAGAEGGQ